MYLGEYWFDTHDVKLKNLNDKLFVSGKEFSILQETCIKLLSWRWKWVILKWVINFCKKYKNWNADYHKDMTATLIENYCQLIQMFKSFSGDCCCCYRICSFTFAAVWKIAKSNNEISKEIQFLNKKFISSRCRANTNKKLFQLISNF